MKRYKASLIRNHQNLEELQSKWEEYQKNVAANYEQQKASFLAQREELIKNLKEAKGKLEQMRKEVSLKANQEEPVDLETPENEDLDMEDPPWEKEDSDLESVPDIAEDVKPKASSKAMFPFGRPNKTPRVER